MSKDNNPDISVVLPAYNEGKNIGHLIIKLKQFLSGMNLNYEIIVIDGRSKDSTQEVARTAGAVVIEQKGKGYGNALKEGFNTAKGEYVLTMDADLSHDCIFIRDLWEKRKSSDLVIASRFVNGGLADMPLSRVVLSGLLNKFFSSVLAIPIKDLSSGFRLYKRSILSQIDLAGTDFNILQEILVRLYSVGWTVREVPFHYKQRREGESKAKLAKFAVSYFKTLRRLWALRNSTESADYDERAFNSRIPLQRYWQRKRYKVIMGFLDTRESILDVGCGTSKIIQNLSNAIALDVSFSKLRYLKKTNKFLANASVMNLPFMDESFSTVICSEVIEYIEKKDVIFEELKRVLKKGGVLIIGTPDYSKVTWRMVGGIYNLVLGGAYGDKYNCVSQYTYDELSGKLKSLGFNISEAKYIYNSELIVKAVKQ
ncbi:MAG: glycosyltransferase [archaeon]